MKKSISIFLLMFVLFGLSACNQQRNKIKGMEIIYEHATELFESNSGRIVGTDIIVFVALPSSMLTPSVNTLSKADSTITIQVDATSKSDLVTDDMAYWKITIKSNSNYLQNIESVKVLVVTKGK